MKKCITDEKNGLDYTLVNGVYLPNVMCPVRLVQVNRANWSQKQQKMSLNYEFYIAV